MRFLARAAPRRRRSSPTPDFPTREGERRNRASYNARMPAPALETPERSVIDPVYTAWMLANP